MAKSVLVLFFLCQLWVTGFTQNIQVLVLGIAQDGGYPQIGCHKDCCAKSADKTFVSSLAVIDYDNRHVWLVDCTPDFPEQWELIYNSLNKQKFELKGIFLTHAHIGHYSGMTQLGREVMGTSSIPVYCMPRMANFLKDNGPWSQLVSLKNIEINEMKDGQSVQVSEALGFRPTLVPHRDEYSETVGFEIIGPNKKMLFIPDIDKWSEWNYKIEQEVIQNDYNLLDATFYSGDELPGRDMSDIPHPFVSESMDQFKALSEPERNRIYFIHMNHSNPILRDSPQRNKVLGEGFNICSQGMLFHL